MQGISSYLILLIFCFLVKSGSSGVRDFFPENESWLDRLPSFEVKVKTDGITVRTGPSRQDLYWTIALVVVGIILVTLIAVAVGFCIYKCCVIPREIARSGMPLTNLTMNSGYPQTALAGIPTLTDNIRLPQSHSPWINNMPNHSHQEKTKTTVSTDHLHPPPPYRSRN